MKHGLWIVVGSVVFVLAGMSIAFAGEPSRWAILIGVNDYANLEDLKFTGQDVEALAARLGESGFPKQQVFLLRDGAKESKYLPYKGNIEKQLDLVLNLVGRDDLLIVAFSGHGMHIDGASYLCPSEADVENPKATMLAVDSLYARLARSPAAMKLVLLDACRNDPRPAGKRSATPKEDNRKLALAIERPPDGMKLLASCGVGQVSYEDAELKQGVFMHYVLEGLSGKADFTKNGKVSVSELYEYVSSAVKVHVARKWSDFQVPYEKGELSGNFEFETSPSAGPASVISNSIGVKLALIPAGEYEMGAGKSEEALAKQYGDSTLFDAERPQHRVRITRPFYCGQFEVTVSQFRVFAQSQNYRTDGEKNGFGSWGYNAAAATFEQKPEYTWKTPSFAQENDHPVVNVSWNDATAFCAWLSRKEGKKYRLPTEAEWEYACRAGSRSLYQQGDDSESVAGVGNVADGTAMAKFSSWNWSIKARDGYVFTAPVGRLKPNAFGLHDMHGNAWEWCADWFSKNYYAGSPMNDPDGPGSGTDRVVRGGDWYDPPFNCRSAHRFAMAPDYPSSNVGFRVVMQAAGEP